MYVLGGSSCALAWAANMPIPRTTRQPNQADHLDLVMANPFPERTAKLGSPRAQVGARRCGKPAQKFSTLLEGRDHSGGKCTCQGEISPGPRCRFSSS